MYDLNILPPKLRKKRKKKIKIGNPTYAPFLLLAVFIVAFFLNKDINEKIAIVDEQIQQSKQQVNTYQSQLSQIDSISSKVQELKNEIENISTLIKGDIQWAYVLDEISAVTPPDTTINSIEDTAEGIRIVAKTLSLTSMAEMKAAMQNNPHFANVDIADFTYQESTILNRPTEVSFVIIFKYVGSDNSDNQGVTP